MSNWAKKSEFTLSTLTFEEDEPGFCCFFGGMIDESTVTLVCEDTWVNWVRVDPYISCT
jgi:hypothetical protein